MSHSHRVSTAPAQRARLRPALPCFGSWRCVRLLGVGRWTEVYQAAAASQFHNSADYVLKTLKSECRDDPLARATLQRQAFLGQTVADPHLESVLDAHVDAPPFYLVAALLEGATLSATLAHAGRLSTPQALWFTRQLAEGLQMLHRHGWLHGDIKPANVFVASSGHATLIDLGLARPIKQGKANPRSALTGTPAYAPPESGSATIAPGPYSDVYSLGVVLFEMLTGQLPFEAGEASGLMRAHVQQPMPEPRHLAPWLPRGVSRLLKSMLAKQPLRRPSLSELIDWLVDLEIDALEERAVVE